MTENQSEVTEFDPTLADRARRLVRAEVMAAAARERIERARSDAAAREASQDLNFWAGLVSALAF